MSKGIVRYEKMKDNIISTIKANQPNYNLVTHELIARVVAQYWAKFKTTKYSAMKGGLSGLIREIVIYFDGGIWHSDLVKDIKGILESVERVLTP